MRLLRAARLLCAVPALVLAAAPAAAQSPVSPPPAAPLVLTADDYARAERFLAPHIAPLVDGGAVRPTWLPDGRFWYRSPAPGGAVVLVDPARGTRTAAVDPARLAAALASASGQTVDAARLPLAGFAVAPDARRVTFTAFSRRWSCDVAAAVTCAPDAAPAPAAPMPNASRSPDGRWDVFIRGHNLWAREVASGRETALTNDGVEDFGYATDNAGWTRSARPIVTWSPDSRRLATFQHDSRGVGQMHLVGTTTGAPTLDSWAYPLPGDSVVFRISRVVVDVPGAAGAAPRVVRLQMPPDAHRSTVSDHIACSGGTLCDAQWTDDARRLVFVSSSRDHKTAWVRVADAATGAVETLFEERSATQIGDASLTENLWRVLPATGELLWWSQRDGWVHLFLYDLATGRLKNRVTSGDGNVDEVLHVDARGRTVTFMGVGMEPGRDPYFRHLYRVGFDGRGLTRLTPEDANHAISLAPDGGAFVDTYSTPDTAPVSVLRDRTGRLVMTLERTDLTRLRASGWKPPTPVRMKARDGVTDIYGLMYTPTRLDPSRRYPMVNHIYPGPQSGSVGTRGFVAARGDNQALAELGFVVVEIDGMGTPSRSKAFHDAYYGRMIDNTLPDQIAGMRDLARQYPFLDTSRVGIWGHSGGGFATSAALFRHPEFFDVGVSQSGNHDNRVYEDDWGERYQGLLVKSGEEAGGTDNYAVDANQTYAPNLRGKLLIAHGMMDDNVPPYGAMLVVDALVKAGKDFDLLVFPHARHGYGRDNAYMMRRRWDYFARHLLGAEPPKEYVIGQLPVGR